MQVGHAETIDADTFYYSVDGEVVFTVFMIEDSDGIWRIDGF